MVGAVEDSDCDTDTDTDIDTDTDTDTDTRDVLMYSPVAEATAVGGVTENSFRRQIILQLAPFSKFFPNRPKDVCRKGCVY